ncbi:MFS transporter [Candidatus Poriferisodalis sp.]|uniref:MFS transporter n=1 Tax=Candidatus Poriferisodalis sp. TaxID=3101277 RepID=UPI003B52CC19
MKRRGTTGEWRRVLLYFGGMMGPLGTFVMLPMIPELRLTFSVTTGQIGWALWCYLVPFAGLLLVSGTIADRWGRARVLRPAVALYAVATLGCAIAPGYLWFLAARVGQGSMNAFITPLLLAMLTETASADRVGRVVGRYAAFQALGQLSAPLLGGIGADTNWRLAYVVTAAVGALIALLLPKSPSTKSESPNMSAKVPSPSDAITSLAPIPPPRLRTLMRLPTLLVATTALLAALGPVGASILVALSGRDVIGLTGSQVGVLLLGGGAAGMVTAPPWGIALDRLGGRRAATIAIATCSALVALLPVAQSTWLLACIWFVAGAAIQATVVSFQSLASIAAPDNRTGALSFTLSLRFSGHAIGSIVWLPVFAVSPTAAYLASAAVGGLAVVAVLASRLDTNGPV